MRFEFATAGRVIVGPGVIAELPSIAREYGSRVLVVTGRDTSRVERPLAALHAAGCACVVEAVAGEPTVATVRAAAARARDEAFDVVVSIGGGSAIDAGKAIAALATNTGDVLEYLEVVGKGQPLLVPPLPFVAVPTTAGTGSEVTRNAVLGSPDHQVKASLRSPLMLPRVALVDPDLARDLPRAITASTGLDALTQLIEPYVSLRANPMTDALCVEGIRHAAGALRAVCEDGRNRAARGAMAVASLFSGLALANAGLGAVHGFAAPIGGRFGAPHGAVCAALLPHVCAMNLRALESRAADHPALKRYDHIARLLTGLDDARAIDGVRWLRALVADLEIPPLRAYGAGASDLETLVDHASRASSMRANPVELTRDELCEIFLTAL